MKSSPFPPSRSDGPKLAVFTIQSKIVFTSVVAEYSALYTKSVGTAVEPAPSPPAPTAAAAAG